MDILESIIFVTCKVKSSSHRLIESLSFVLYCLNDKQSKPVAVTSGIPQGTRLAPLLFLCFINDLPDKITSKIRLYADSVLLYSTINSVEDCYTLQEDLNTLNKWSQTWKMKLNTSQCEFLYSK